MDIKSVSVLADEDCCGCGACYSKCPVDAIVMKLDNEGFLYPNIDEQKCVNCGLCCKVCPSINTIYNKSKEPSVYAAWADDKIRKKSSSGGMFTLYAEEIINRGGVVCGAAFNNDFVVEHIIVDNKEGLDKLRGSKYVQSDTKDVFPRLEKFLKEGRDVLFCGCPCQVAGLYSYLGKKYEELFTMDLLCAGATSPGLFEKYKEQVHSGKKIIDISFRDKKHYGWIASMTVKYNKGKPYRRARNNDVFYDYFLKNIASRPFCTTCKFSKLPRQGDITLGDFWNIAKYKKELDDGLGTSVMTINSHKGKVEFEKVRNRMVLCEGIPIEFLIERRQPFQKHKTPNPKRTQFLELINTYSIERAHDYVMNNKYDVAIFGVWWGSNYGSLMTYYSLYRLVESFGLRAIMIDRPNYPSNHRIFHTHARRFCNKYYKAISPVYKFEELTKLNEQCDTFLIGSDQVWNYGISKHYKGGFFLNFADDNKKKISYAASFGHHYFSGDSEAINEAGTLLSRFDYISVREEDAVNIMKNTFGLKATRVLDPVFVADSKIYDEIANTSKAEENEPFVAAYILDPSPEKRNSLLYIAKKKNMKLVVMLDGFENHFSENKEKMNLDDNVIENLEVQDWLYYIKNCSYLITDSCHGASFGIIYKKSFVCIGNESRGMSRFNSLFRLLKIEDRLVMDAENILNNTNLLEDIDYDSVYSILDKEKKSSLKWLENALFSSVTEKKNNYKVPEHKIKNFALRIYKKYIRKHISDNIENSLKKFWR